MFRSANSRNAPKQPTYRARTLPLGLKVGTFGTRSIRTIRNANETLRATLIEATNRIQYSCCVVWLFNVTTHSTRFCVCPLLAVFRIVKCCC
jgi:hypothetical protein